MLDSKVICATLVLLCRLFWATNNVNPEYTNAISDQRTVAKGRGLLMALGMESATSKVLKLFRAGWMPEKDWYATGKKECGSASWVGTVSPTVTNLWLEELAVKPSSPDIKYSACVLRERAITNSSFYSKCLGLNKFHPENIPAILFWVKVKFDLRILHILIQFNTVHK